MLSVVIVPNLPKNAKSEWHAIAAERCYETKGLIFCVHDKGHILIFYIFSVTEEEHTKVVTKSSKLYEFTCKKMTALKTCTFFSVDKKTFL